MSASSSMLEKICFLFEQREEQSSHRNIAVDPIVTTRQSLRLTHKSVLSAVCHFRILFARKHIKKNNTIYIRIDVMSKHRC